ncbi:MAG: 2-oxoacid:acceptor oxidoreductase family protein [Angelakisella sp.]
METNLCVAGFGGQGVMTLGKFLASATCDATNKNVTFFPSYGAEQRGGTANCFVVISDEEIGAPLGDVMDDLIVMNGPSLKKFLPTLKKGGTLFINSSIVSDDIGRDDVKLVKAPVTEMALEMGNAKVLNVIMLGVYVGYTEVVPPEVVWSTIEHKMAKKPKLLPLNKEAFEKDISVRAEKFSCSSFYLFFRIIPASGARHFVLRRVAFLRGKIPRERLIWLFSGGFYSVLFIILRGILGHPATCVRVRSAAAGKGYRC